MRSCAARLRVLILALAAFAFVLPSWGQSTCPSSQAIAPATPFAMAPAPAAP